MKSASKLLIATLVFALVSTCWVPARAQQGASGIDIIILLDASTSMAGSDPANLRQKSLKVILGGLSPVEGVRNRLGIFRFTDKVTSVRPLTAIFDPEEVSVPVGLEGSRGTDFAKALQAAYDEFNDKEAFDKNRELVVLLVSDLVPDISELQQAYPTMDDYQRSEADAVNRLIAKGCRIYALQLATRGDRAHWTEIVQRSGGRLWLLTQDSVDTVVAELAQELGLHALVPKMVFGTGVKVPPYREWMVLTLWRSGSALPSDVVTVKRPDGSVVKETDADLLRYASSPQDGYLICKIAYPQEGIWKTSVVGGELQTWADLGPSAVSIQFRAPWRVVSAAQPLRVTASVEYRGRPLDDERIKVTAVLTAPGVPKGMEVPFDRVSSEEGAYYEFRAASPPQAGEYTIAARAVLDWDGDEQVLSEASHRFVAATVPFVRDVVIEGTRLVEEPFRLTAFVDNASLISGRAAITAEVVSPAGQRLSLTLEPVSAGVFTANVNLSAAHIAAPGDYAATVYLSAGQMVSGLEFPESRYGIRFTLGSAQLPSLAEARVGGAHFVNEPFPVSVRVTLHDLIEGSPQVYVRIRQNGDTWATVALRDDGVAPDERAGDGIFSAEAPGDLIQNRGQYEFVFTLAEGRTKNGGTFPTSEITTRADFVLPQEVPPHRFVVSPLARYSLLALLLLLLVFAWWYFFYYLPRDLERGLQTANAAAAAGNYALASRLYARVAHKAKERDILHTQRIRAAAAQAFGRSMALRPLDSATYARLRELIRSSDSRDRQIAAIALYEKWRFTPETAIEDIHRALKDGRPDMLLSVALASLETDPRWASREVRSFRLRPSYWKKGKPLDKTLSFLDTYDPVKMVSNANERRSLGKRLAYPQEDRGDAGEA